MKLVSKKLTLGLGCAVAALTFTACGGGVPDCDDSDVQDAVKKIYTERWLENNFYGAVANDDHKEASNFSKKAQELVMKELNLTMNNFATNRVDEKRNRVTCQAKIAGDMKSDKIIEMLDLFNRAAAARSLNDGEVLTDGKFEDYIKSMGGQSAYDKRLEKMADDYDQEFSDTQHNLEYTARRTDDGNLVVEVEGGLPGRH
ncbi:hypothetical protein LS74_002305 [Helicobacter magdeburgensis]|uniref:Lipoprotein n=1 Tax=Helicobacter magdeburgensis TaxID=471858 RepID=A0A4U8T2B0_9HELI|nr:hypothetical protein [Helicobacter magdeburgensis]TLD93566.1 hypothetical protein LS74_002305 [Helicobacter magdeburgensis]